MPSHTKLEYLLDQKDTMELGMRRQMDDLRKLFAQRDEGKNVTTAVYHEAYTLVQMDDQYNIVMDQLVEEMKPTPKLDP